MYLLRLSNYIICSVQISKVINIVFRLREFQCNTYTILTSISSELHSIPPPSVLFTLSPLLYYSSAKNIAENWNSDCIGCPLRILISAFIRKGQPNYHSIESKWHHSLNQILIENDNVSQSSKWGTIDDTLSFGNKERRIGLFATNKCLYSY